MMVPGGYADSRARAVKKKCIAKRDAQVSISVAFVSTDTEPPRIQCPSVKEKTAEPNKLTARVFWDTPEGRDTADGILTE